VDRVAGEVPAGGWAPGASSGRAGVERAGRPPAGYFTRRLAEKWLDAVLVQARAGRLSGALGEEFPEFLTLPAYELLD
jgi:hypothetical protein